MQLSLHSHRENLNQTTLNRILLCDQKLGLLALEMLDGRARFAPTDYLSEANNNGKLVI